MSIHRLTNLIQTYDWGSTTAISMLLGLPNPSGERQAELWMGAHPSAPSCADGQPLDALIAAAPRKTLGFDGTLPFLFKVLAAAKPLSIQAHPSLEQAIAGYARENAAGIPIDAPHRNYRDANHQPAGNLATKDLFIYPAEIPHRENPAPMAIGEWSSGDQYPAEP